MDVKIAMQHAGIRIAHSRAVFEMRDCSPTVNDRYAPASGPSCCRAETGSTPDDCAYYRVADGEGQTTAACEQASMWVATEDLPRSAAHPADSHFEGSVGANDHGVQRGLCQSLRLSARLPDPPVGQLPFDGAHVHRRVRLVDVRCRLGRERDVQGRAARALPYGLSEGTDYLLTTGFGPPPPIGYDLVADLRAQEPR